jgi:hypothetical protein
MNIFRSDAVDYVILVTGIINIVLILVVFLSCRFFPSARIAQSMVKAKWYKGIYRYHSYLWWVLMPSVIIHAFFAIAHRLSGG